MTPSKSEFSGYYIDHSLLSEIFELNLSHNGATTQAQVRKLQRKWVAFVDGVIAVWSHKEETMADVIEASHIDENFTH